MIETERLTLRRWRDEDIPALLAICRDPAVMEFIGPLEDEAGVTKAIERQQQFQSRDGFCYWAAEERASGTLVGFCGLEMQEAPMPIAGDVDIGWRLARAYWGRGLATEAAGVCLAWAWRHDIPRVVAITVTANRRSRAVMERLGMTRLSDRDFDHPALLEGDPLRRHVLYTIDRPA